MKVHTLLVLPLALLFASMPVLADGHPVTMWKVSGDTNAVYILGSIHLLRPQDHPLPTVIEAAYEESETILMELDMDDLDPFATQALFVRYGKLANGETLADRLGANHYETAAALAERQGIPLHMLDQVEPWYAAVMVELIALSRIGFDPTLGIEMWVTTMAARDGKEIEGLETAEEQIRMLDGLPDDAQREMLISTLEELAALQDMMDELIQAWRMGDTDLLESEMLEPLSEYDDLFQAILVDRNNRWVEQIMALLDDDEDYLVVVGSLHLVGDVGVPEQLEARGVEIHKLNEGDRLR